MPLPLYLVAYTGQPRDHHALFLETVQDEGGYLFHVIGNVMKGMTYELRSMQKAPKESFTYAGMTHLGWVSSADISRIDEICRSNPPPEKQYTGLKKTNPKKPLRKCQEWTSETINLLERHGVLNRTNSSAHSYSNQASASLRASESSSAISSSTHKPVHRETSGDGYWIWSAKYSDWYHLSADGSVTWAGQRSTSRSNEKGKGPA